MRRLGQPNDGPSASLQTKRVRFNLTTDEPTTSRVGAPELSNRIGTWWMNPRMADVRFNVGPPDGVSSQRTQVREVIPAHILVVAPASEVFSAMLLGSFEVPPTIDVPDGDPDAFKEMLRYVYTDRAVVTIGNASDILYLAKKYLLSGLIKQVIGYLKANIYLNFSAIYQEASLHEEMREVCTEFIAKHSHDLFLSEEFVELDFDVMRKVAVKSLAVDTLTFYRKLLEWAQEECQRRSVDASTTNMRSVLADAFKLIRFVALSPEEFEQGPGSDELLTVHEKAVLRHWHAHGDFRSVMEQKPVTTFRIFAADPEFLHGSECVCAITERQAIADAIAHSPIEFSATEIFSLVFETDKCIFFSGVVCSFQRCFVSFVLKVDGRTLAKSASLGWDNKPSYTFDCLQERKGLSVLKLSSPVLVQAHRKCQLTIYPSTQAVGTQTRRVTQIIGRELEKSDGTTAPLQDGERRVRHDSEPVHFALTHGTSPCVFAEILYRYVDDTIYGA